MTGSVAGIRRRRTVAGRRETPHLPPDLDFYGQTLTTVEFGPIPGFRMAVENSSQWSGGACH